MRRSATEVINELENRIARLERRSALALDPKDTKKASRIPVSPRQLQTVIMHLNDEYGLDEMDEEIDLELSVRDWTFEHSSRTDKGLPILVLSIESDYNGEVYYAIFVETIKGKYTEMGLTEGINSYERTMIRLESRF